MRFFWDKQPERPETYMHLTLCPNCNHSLYIEIPYGTPLNAAPDGVCPRCGVGYRFKKDAGK